MEYNRSNSFQAKVQQLFHFYDRAGIGVISKAALLAYFSQIDKLITEEWLIKILLPRGVTLKQSIKFDQFLQIMQTLRSLREQQEYLGQN